MQQCGGVCPVAHAGKGAKRLHPFTLARNKNLTPEVHDRVGNLSFSDNMQRELYGIKDAANIFVIADNNLAEMWRTLR